MRAAAALAVVFFHTQEELRNRGFADPFPDLTAGAFGVDLFFAISGFIMVYASQALFGTARNGPYFLWSRIVRIVPLYWVSTAMWASIAFLLSRDPDHPPFSLGHVLLSAVFVPAGRPGDGAFLPVNPLGWTLNYEMFFYLCFSAAICLRLSVAVAAVALCLSLLCLAGVAVPLPNPLAYWADPIVVEFIFGMIVARMVLTGRHLPDVAGALLAMAAVLVAWSCAPVLNAHPHYRFLVWGIPAACLVAAGTLVRSRPAGIVVRVLAALGDASYSLYLVHSIVFIVAFALLARVIDPHILPPAIYAGGIVSASVAAALASYRWFERPVTRRLKRLVSNRRSARVRTAALRANRAS